MAPPHTAAPRIFVPLEAEVRPEGDAVVRLRTRGHASGHGRTIFWTGYNKPKPGTELLSTARTHTGEEGAASHQCMHTAYCVLYIACCMLCVCS